MKINKTVFDLNDIMRLLPHREPFLFVDRIVRFKRDRYIQGEKYLDPDHPVFKGHFPGNPILPGVIAADALAQVSGLLWGFSKQESEKEVSNDKNYAFFLTSTNVKFITPGFAGETMTLVSQPLSRSNNLYPFNVEAFSGKKTICRGRITLAMDVT
ncbi:MAG: 3-hydroxyacyl-ACP dehydratase FabZ family protein [Chitinivibrionales bacterium]